MRRETAYKLAGRRHDHGAANPGVEKRREIRFRPFPPGQVDQAFRSLRMLKGVKVERGERGDTLVLQYSVLGFTLEIIETALVDAGFHLDQSLYSKLRRALVYFVEETQRHNLLSPERLIKQSNEVYIQVYDQHLHGDHDETPLELREFR